MLRAQIKQAIYRPRGDFALEPGDRAFIGEYYRRDLNKLSAVLGYDFSGWLQAAPSAPTLVRASVV